MVVRLFNRTRMEDRILSGGKEEKFDRLKNMEKNMIIERLIPARTGVHKCLIEASHRLL